MHYTEMVYKLQVSLMSKKFCRTYLGIYSVLNFVIQFMVLIGTDSQGESGDDDEYI
jgi:hypothetical protein